MTGPYSTAAIEKLLSAQDYRKFIRLAIEERARGLNRKFGYADIARLAGFSARSFPRQVVLGEKNISLNSVAGFTRALKLNRALAQFFQLLVEIEHPECRLTATSTERLKKLRHQLRTRILARTSPELKKIKTIFDQPDFPRIYAALGSLEKGSIVQEIADRSKLTRKKVTDSLKSLIEFGLVRQEKARYFATENLITLDSMDSKDAFFNYFKAGLQLAAEESKKDFKSEEKLFFQAVFSVDQVKLPVLKSELREVLLRFISENEQEDGSGVSQINCSFF